METNKRKNIFKRLTFKTMYHFAIAALLILLYSLFAEKIENTVISGPIIFLLVGLAIGPIVLNIIPWNVGNGGYKITWISLR